MVDMQSHDTFEIERLLSSRLDRVWAAWAIPEKKMAWYGNSVSEVDFRPGGCERGAYSNGMGEHTKEATFFEIEECRRIVYAYSMAMNGKVHTVSLVTIIFDELGEKTRLRHIEQMCVIPPSDGAQGRRKGWQALLDQLESYLANEDAREGKQ